MLISECLGNDKGIPELRNAIRHFVKTVTNCLSPLRYLQRHKEHFNMQSLNNGTKMLFP